MDQQQEMNNNASCARCVSLGYESKDFLAIEIIYFHFGTECLRDDNFLANTSNVTPRVTGCRLVSDE